MVAAGMTSAMKRLTPNGILVTVALLAIYAAYAGWSAYVDRSWTFAVVAAGALAASVGTALLRPWSQFLVYLLVVGIVGGWCWSIYASLRAGYFGLLSPSQLVVTLAPGTFIALLSVACAFIVFRHFRKEPAREVSR
jgi:hypothetical protein